MQNRSERYVLLIRPNKTESFQIQWPVETLEHTENTESFKIDQHTVGNLIPEDQCDES